MTPEQRSMRARLAAHSKWANTDDRASATAPARQAAKDRWLKLADPNGILSLAARAEKAAQLEKAHYTRMALASSLARAKRRAS